jgi:hypothetical protein
MRLLCHITSNIYGEFVHHMALETDYDSAHPCDPCDLDGRTACADLARMGAANAALAHLEYLSAASARRTRGPDPAEGPRVTRGPISRFVSWICEAPGVFRDLRERGLLENLVDMLHSSDGDERVNAGFAVGVLAIRHDSARGPLRALWAIRPLTQKLQVGPEGYASGQGFD